MKFLLFIFSCMLIIFFIKFIVKIYIYNKRRIKTKKGIEINEYININGIEQYVSIRGKDRNLPVLIMFHGGPGCSLIPYSYKYQDELEEKYVVVNWDQRCSGKTYVKNKNTKNNIDILIDDAKVLVLYIRKLLNVDKVTIMGHSGGSVLGINFVSKYPEYVEKYIGVSQVVSQKEALLYYFDKLKNVSKNDKIKIDEMTELLKINKCTHEDINKGFGIIYKYLGLCEPFLSLLILPFFSPYMNIYEFYNFSKLPSSNLFEDLYNYLTYSYNLFDIKVDEKIPLIFITGEKDFSTCVNLVDKYCSNHKNAKNFCIQDCGHVPFYAKTREFLDIMNKI